ncbi:MAG: hypothetical protein ABI461_19650, partial [Polyangiaceae bacterium]
MRTHSLFTSVLILSTLGAVACSSSPSSDVGDDGNSPPNVVNPGGDNGDAGDSGAVIGTPPADAGVPVNCDVTATPAANACVVNETLGVFVAPPSATDASAPDGTRGRPYTKLQQAIDTAKAQQKRVYACIGDYAEQITLADGVSIFGDLDCNRNWDVVTAHASLKAPASPAVHADQIKTATRIDSLDLVAPDATVPGGSSIALIANASPALTIANAAIHAGAGMKGADGVEGTQLSNAGSAPGSDNSNSLLAPCVGIVTGSCISAHAVAPAGGTNLCMGGPAIVSGPGGAGGIGIGDAVVTSTATFIEFGNQYYMIPGILASNGNPQPGNALTAAGGTKGNVLAATGSAGATGAVGANGASASQIGTISSAGFTPVDGSVGTNGQPGQGGGGGAGYDYVTKSTTNYSVGDAIYFSNGAGGGAGGCPGLAGASGKGGGASIAIIANDSPLTLDTCTVQSSAGGDGGKGTLGSAASGGAPGGADRDACPTANLCLLAYKPHNGGAGGAGGQPGWSGSGAGGSSIGIAFHGAQVVLKSTTPAVGTA